MSCPSCQKLDRRNWSRPWTRLLSTASSATNITTTPPRKWAILTIVTSLSGSFNTAAPRGLPTFFRTAVLLERHEGEEADLMPELYVLEAESANNHSIT